MQRRQNKKMQTLIQMMIPYLGRKRKSKLRLAPRRQHEVAIVKRTKKKTKPKMLLKPPQISQARNLKLMK